MSIIFMFFYPVEFFLNVFSLYYLLRLVI